MFEASPLAWALFLALILAMLAIDLFILHRKAHEIQFREAILGTLLPVTAAALFSLLLYFSYQHHWLGLGQHAPAEFLPDNGPQAVLQFITGYLIELSLSADNIFLFVVLMRYFRVRPQDQHQLLFWGVLGAILMRAAMILTGTALLARFSWILYLFGGLLLVTGLKMLRSDESADPQKNAIIRFLSRWATPGTAAPFWVVLLAIELTDLVFAVDSIPAVFAITQDPFLVFTSNIFAILGLRSMYFLLAGVIDKFHLLKLALALILLFVGTKMLLPALGGIHIPPFVSLLVVCLLLVGAIVGSLVLPPKKHGELPQ